MAPPGRIGGWFEGRGLSTSRVSPPVHSKDICLCRNLRLSSRSQISNFVLMTKFRYIVQSPHPVEYFEAGAEAAGIPESTRKWSLVRVGNARL